MSACPDPHCPGAIELPSGNLHVCDHSPRDLATADTVPPPAPHPHCLAVRNLLGRAGLTTRILYTNAVYTRIACSNGRSDLGTVDVTHDGAALLHVRPFGEPLRRAMAPALAATAIMRGAKAVSS